MGVGNKRLLNKRLQVKPVRRKGFVQLASRERGHPSSPGNLRRQPGKSCPDLLLFSFFPDFLLGLPFGQRAWEFS
jgi:hypothetical protein